MSIVWQVSTGSALLLGCLILHAAILLQTVMLLTGTRKAKNEESGIRHWKRAMAITLSGILLSHTIQIWALAFVTLVIGALPGLADSFYFSLVTYTTLGYGDVTLSADFRIFGAMGAVTGLLAFGLSTALLVGLFTRMLSDRTS